MKLFEIRDHKFGKAFDRISKALIDNSPDGVEWVGDKNQADYTVIHTVGGEQLAQMREMDLSKVINIQHCVFTTWSPIEEWEPIWEKALLNVSFHDLKSYTTKEINALRIPWGADVNLFTNQGLKKHIDVFATGHVADTECIDLVYRACKNKDKVLYHTGENFRYQAPNYKHLSYMDDTEFVKRLNSTKFTSCLRRVEGFELMGIEGALCGAVPIVPRLPTYDFYEGFGEFVDMDGDIVSQVENLLDGNYFMTGEKIDYVRDKFSWQTICSSFYGALR